MTAAGMDVEKNLFVYGTLAPGQANHYLLEKLPGTWRKGIIDGLLYPDGTGPTTGYPVVDIEASVETIAGFLFTSESLPGYWQNLDEFEGEGYRRVITIVTLPDKSRLEAFVYALDSSFVA